MSGIEIPEHCGAILLKDITLFPQGALPLHIFEPRYQEMLDDALEGSCMICVGTLESDETTEPSSCVANIGTVGLIRASREQEDGRSNLLLHGVIRVNFDSWSKSRNYPYAHITPLSNPIHNKPQPLVDDLCKAIAEVLAPFPQEIRKNIDAVVEKSRHNPSLIADAVSQQFIQDPTHRKMLLEERNIEKRLHFLIGFLQQAARKIDEN